jgi:hypothetical protein
LTSSNGTSPGRVVRIGDEDHFGLRCHGFQDRVDIGGEILLRHGDRLRAGSERRDRVNQEAVLCVDRFVAVGEIGARQKVEQIVGTSAAHNAARVEAEHPPDRLAQCGRRAVGIVLQV